MKLDFKDVALTLTALLALGASSAATAQDISTTLPLTSVGDQLMWAVSDQALTLQVPTAGRIRLELYSPRLAPDDYRRADAYGDERYAPGAPVSTTFTLVDGRGQVVDTRTFTPGPHAWETLLDQDLPAGTYTLRVQTAGNAKNTFAVRLAGLQAELSAERLTVNVHSRAWVPALRVTTDGPGYTVRMYDGDGPREIEARLRDAQGRVVPLPVSADLQDVDLTLPALAGEYVIELRQPASARQYSNAVSFSLHQGGQNRPITLARVDQTGTLRVGAQLVLPSATLPARVDLLIDGRPVQVDGQGAWRVASGPHALQVPAIPGADVQVSAAGVTVPRSGQADATIQVRPQAQFTLQADRDSVCEGDTVTFTARATTAFAGALPLQVTLRAPPALRLTSPVSVNAPLSATQPAELHFTAVAEQAGAVAVQAAFSPWDTTQTVQITVQPGTLDAASGQCAAPPAAAALPAPAEPPAVSTPPSPAPVVEAPPASPAQTEYSEVRRSELSLPYVAPAAQDLIVAHRPPSEGAYVPGSSRLNGQVIPDPVAGPSGRLYWVLPADTRQTTRGSLTYELTHSAALPPLDEPALLARLRGGRTETLQGQLDLKDYAAARPLAAAPVAAENAGAIKLPLQGAQVRVRDRVSVTVEAPLAETHPLIVNGVTVGDDQIGETTEDGPRGIRRLTYVGVPLQPGPNTLSYAGQTVTVYRVGPTDRVTVEPLSLVADGSTPIRLRVRTVDRDGLVTHPDFVTLRSNLQPLTPDANPADSGYQLRLVNGEGVLELRAQAAPTTLVLDTLVGQDVTTRRYDITPDDSRVGVGVLSVTLGLDGDLSLDDDLTWQARASYEGPLAGGKVYVAADKDGLPTDRDTLTRYAVTGDASAESVPLQGLDPVAFTYDHPAFRVQYRQTALPIDVIPVGEQLTALTAYSKTNPQVAAFVAAVPEGRISEERVVPEGTRLVRLARGDISPGSETLELVTLERGTGKELRRLTLIRNVDYQIDLSTGIITLTQALDPLDLQLNEQVILASYRLNSDLSNRPLAYGAQVRATTGPFTLGAAAVQLDGTLTLGARATYESVPTRAEGYVASAGGLQATADFRTRLGTPATGPSATFTARVRYQDPGYVGLSPITPGLNADATLDAQLTPNLRGLLNAEYHSMLPAGSTPGTEGGSVTARAAYTFQPFTVGAGLKYGVGDIAGLSAIGSAGYHQGPLDVDLVHAQPLTGNLRPETTLTTRYRLNPNLTLGFTDKLTWGVGHAAALTLDSIIGNVNYAAAYELPNASGGGNLARFGVSTTLPLTPNLSARVRGSATYNLTTAAPTLGAGVDLHYRTEQVTATTGLDGTYTPQGFGVVARAGITGQLTPQLSLTADGLIEYGAGKNGQRAAVGYAYRSGTFNSLGAVRYVQGTLAGGQPELSSNVSAEYHQPTFAVRAGMDTRTLLNDPDSFTLQAGLGGTLYLTKDFGVGAWGHLLTQPAANTVTSGLGLEASLRVLPGTWLTAGYNLSGFDGLSKTLYTRPGLYLRLDLTLDDTLGASR